jgi:predicted dehydrogenase
MYIRLGGGVGSNDTATPLRPSTPRVGVVGAGYWGPNLIRNLAELPGSPLAAVADANPARLDYIRARYPAVALYDAGATLFNAPGIDAVVIATPAETHYALAREALLAGKHVFVEKPLATSGAQCLELARIAHDRGLTLMAGHTFVHNDALRWTKQQLDAGTLGDVHYLYSRRLNLGQIRQDINVVWNLAPHDISIMGFLLDARPNRVSCAGYAYIQNGVEDVAFVTLEYPPITPAGTPRSAHIHVSWLDPHKVREVVVVGTRQMIVYDDVDADRVIQVYDKGVDRVPVPESTPGTPGGHATTDPRERAETYGEFKLLLRWGDLHIPRLRLGEPLRNEMAHFVHCVATGARPITDAVNGWEVVRVLEACDASLRARGAPVEIDWSVPADAPPAFHAPRGTS